MPPESIIQALFISVALLLLLGATVGSEGSCPQVTIIPESSNYVQKDVVECNEFGTLLFFVYEDCPNKNMIFEVEGDFDIDGCNGWIFRSGNQFGFAATSDAESTSRSHVCSPFLQKKSDVSVKFSAQFIFADVNEYQPEPAGGLSSVQSIEVDENTLDAVFEFGYKDLDYGETQTLTCTPHFESDAAAMFEIALKNYDEENDMMLFLLKVTGNLDFEKQSFYNLLAEFTSKDSRGASSSLNQTFLIFVQDLGDNPPFFTQIQPSATCEEETQGEFIFEVKAQDRDVTINNKISYSIVSGNEDKFFEINEHTGKVYTSSIKRIDRETLVSTFFSLEIQAMEVLDEQGTPAPNQDTTSQVTNVNILDINDNIPVFDIVSPEVHMDEFDETQTQVSKTLDLVLTVIDMDEGAAGEYDLSSEDSNVVLNPTSASGNTTISITLMESDNFNYEVQADNPIITVEILATERENFSHSSTATLTIELLDINDKPPLFDKNEYQAEVNEISPGGTEILKVSATDDDATNEFGEKGLVYSLKNCGDQLTIEPQTGKISLSQSTELDYEEEKEIECKVRVNDMEGTSSNSLSDEVDLTIVVTDVNDEVPSFSNFENNVKLQEGTKPTSVVASVEVTDPDTGASLEVSLEFESDTNPLVEQWFQLEESKDSTPNKYKGNILVAKESDRETADKVVMRIKAVDIKASEGIQETIETLQVVIIDVNDETPEFVGDYISRNVDENTPIDTVIFVVLATDPDTDDRITFSISDPKNYLKIDENTGEVSVQAIIDHEVTSEFEVEIFAEDKVGHTNTVTIQVVVIDMNDNKPILDNEACTAHYDVSEDEENGHSVTKIKATDEDEGIHAEISYILKNSNYVVDDIQFAPFAINKTTGEIIIQITGSNRLDRERQSKWILVIDAFDNCDVNDPKCEVKNDECFMTIYVKDVNDNGPGNFKLSTGSTIITDEALLEEQLIPKLEISAVDPDQPNDKNSELTFEVISMTFTNDTATSFLFKATTESRINSENIVEFFCTLTATVDLTGLQGEYLIEIQAADQGKPQLKASTVFPLSIQDVNDMSPIFSFSHCLTESQQTIHMKENFTPLNFPLKCTSDASADVAEIMVTDDDKPHTPNSKVMLVIDYQSSVAVDAGPENQLSAFQIYHYEDAGRFAIAISEIIDRERGIKYNLSLVAMDSGEIPNETPSWIFIIVEDISEFPPIFCDESPCKETIYLKENSKAVTKFPPAEDKDNGKEDINELVYYMILAPDSDVFKIPDPKVPEIQPVVPLDREKCDRYLIKIWAYNEKQVLSPETEDSNQILSVTVEVLDVNDEIPIYDDVIYGEFSDTGSKLGEEVALLAFLDKDFNDSLTYTFASEFLWSEGYHYPDPFKIKRLDDRKSKIILNIDPQGKSGYCSFQVEAKDEALHSTSAEVEVFVVTNEYMVSFYFLNDKEEVDKNQQNIEKIFTLVFGYTCVINSITTAKDEENNEIKGQTVVLAHFIREKRVNSDNKDSGERRFLKMKNGPKQRSHRALVNENPRQNNQLRTQGILEFFPEGSYHLDKRGEEQLNSRKDQYLVNTLLDHPLMGYFQKYISQNKGGLRIPGKRSWMLKKEQNSGGNQVEYELVPKEEIEKMGVSGTITSELDNQLDILGLNLARIGDGGPLDQDSDDEQVIINLKIALACSCLFLGLLIVLLVILFIVRTTKLKREIKALSTQSMADGKPNEKRFEMSIPGSNQYASEGTNPVWNPKEDTGCVADAGSNSSGGSMFVGAEDNPIFQYQQKEEESLTEVGKQTQKGDHPPDIFGDFSQNVSRSPTKVNPLMTFKFDNERQSTDSEMPFEASSKERISQQPSELTKFSI